MIDNWKDFIDGQRELPYMQSLEALIKSEGDRLAPSPKNIYAAFRFTSFTDTRVILIGQDPYPRRGDATGLAFSGGNEKYIPASLKVIFRELLVSTGVTRYNPNLTDWARQGCLLLNRILTTRVEETKAHEGKGWEVFTGRVIKHLADNKENLVFVLWGNYAQESEEYITPERGHLVLKSPHPAAEAHKPGAGFYGCNHFNLINRHLVNHNDNVITWG